MASRRLSEKAKKFLYGTDPLTVYEYADPDQSAEDIDENGERKLYAYGGLFGDREGLTFDEMQAAFEGMQDEVGRPDVTINNYQSNIEVFIEGEPVSISKEDSRDYTEQENVDAAMEQVEEEIGRTLTPAESEIIKEKLEMIFSFISAKN